MIRCDINEKSVTAVGGKTVLSLELGYIINDFLKNPQFRSWTIAAILAGLRIANVTEEEKRQIFEILRGE